MIVKVSLQYLARKISLHISPMDASSGRGGGGAGAVGVSTIGVPCAIRSVIQANFESGSKAAARP